MKIRHKLTLYFSLASTLLILAFGVSVYFFSAQYRKNEFFQRLKTRVEIAEKFFLEKSSFSKEEYTTIRNQFLNTLPYETEEVAALTPGWQNRLTCEYPPDFLNSIVNREEVFFHSDSIQGAGRVFHLTDGDYAVIITAVDRVGMRVLKNLRTIITLTIMVCILVISWVSYSISKHLISPILRKIRKANTISSTNLHERLIVYNPDDELGEMAIAFNNLLDRLENAFIMQKLFVANASHEIRNPLTAILGETEIALTKDRSIEDYQESLRNISSEADRLNLLINNLFQLSSISYDNVNIKREVIVVEELIYSAQKKYELANSNAKLQLSFGDHLKIWEPLLWGNKNLLETALINILDNASKFSSNGIVNLTASRENDMMLITVKDSGIGIPPTDISKITQPFFRADNVRQIRGTGIGIPLTLRILEIHNGGLKVESELNKGTTVTITLPLITHEQVKIPSKSAQRVSF